MSTSDWHREDIMAAIRKTGVTLSGLARAHGMHPTVVNTALLRPWPHVEAIVADRLGLRPQDIWPSRYDADGKPLKGGTRWRKNHSAPIDSEHFQKREAA